MTPLAEEQFGILRRIAERGLKYSSESTLTFCTDLFQHLLDELDRLKKERDV